MKTVNAWLLGGMAVYWLSFLFLFTWRIGDECTGPITVGAVWFMCAILGVTMFFAFLCGRMWEMQD